MAYKDKDKQREAAKLRQQRRRDAQKPKGVTQGVTEVQGVTEGVTVVSEPPLVVCMIHTLTDAQIDSLPAGVVKPLCRSWSGLDNLTDSQLQGKLRRATWQHEPAYAEIIRRILNKAASWLPAWTTVPGQSTRQRGTFTGPLTEERQLSNY